MYGICILQYLLCRGKVRICFSFVCFFLDGLYLNAAKCIKLVDYIELFVKDFAHVAYLILLSIQINVWLMVKLSGVQINHVFSYLSQ
jgi:hypothetical protein